MSPKTPRTPRRGHLRDVEDGLPTVPELLETDALLDRLGRHQTTDQDLHDTVARILDVYALHADPETAGARPLELPVLAEVLSDPAPQEEAPAPRAPRVLTARRRTLERVGRGGVAAAAVLALMGGTAAAAATGGGSFAGGDSGTVSAPSSAGLPAWVPTAVIEVFGGTPEQKAHREIAQAKKLAQSGDAEAIALAEAQIDRAVDLLQEVGAPVSVISSAQAEIAMLGQSTASSAAVAPGTSPTSLASLVAGSRTVATPSPTASWRAPQVTPTATTTLPVAPSAPTGSATTVPSTPTRPTTAPPSSSPGSETTTGGTSGGSTAPTSPVPTTPTSPGPSTQPESPTTTTVPTAPVTSPPVTTEPVEPTDPATGTETGSPTEPAVVTTPVTAAATTAPAAGAEPVVVPSPEAGVAPSPTDSTPLVVTTQTVTEPAVPTDADGSLTS